MSDCKFSIVAPAKAAKSFVEVKFELQDGSASKAINIAAMELARHSRVVAGFERMLESEGVIIRIKFRSGVTLKEKKEFVKNFIHNTNSVPLEMYLSGPVDFNQVYMSGQQSLLRG